MISNLIKSDVPRPVTYGAQESADVENERVTHDPIQEQRRIRQYHSRV